MFFNSYSCVAEIFFLPLSSLRKRGYRRWGCSIGMPPLPGPPLSIGRLSPRPSLQPSGKAQIFSVIYLRKRNFPFSPPHHPLLPLSSAKSGERHGAESAGVGESPPFPTLQEPPLPPSRQFRDARYSRVCPQPQALLPPSPTLFTPSCSRSFIPTSPSFPSSPRHPHSTSSPFIIPHSFTPLIPLPSHYERSRQTNHGSFPDEPNAVCQRTGGSPCHHLQHL